MLMHFENRAALAMLAWISIAAMPSAAQAQTFSAAELQSDLRFAIDTIKQKHPDLAHSVSVGQLEEAARKVQSQLVRPMDQAEAWAALAQLNPVLADGHLFIGLPGWRTETASLIRNGTGLFPFEVRVDKEGYPVILSALGGSASPLSGRRITRINGRNARDITKALSARMHGDTPALRSALLSQRWWLYYSKLYGTPAQYDFDIAGSRQQGMVPAARTLPAFLQDEQRFDRLFSCRIEVGGAARMTVASFAWDDKAQFLAFTQDCFSRIKAASADRLLIDVSANSGGNDDHWKDGIVRYIATIPYKHGSDYLKREPSGALTVGAIETATEAVANEPLHFSGSVSVLIGPLTYSSAVLFSNVVRSYGFGTIVGEGGAARTKQSGGVLSVKLPNSGLMLFYPRFVLAPPTGTKLPKLLLPERPL